MNNKRHLISPMDFSKGEIDDLLELGEKIAKDPKEYANVCSGKILGSLFFEPSTRTRLSFEAAMNRLGGNVIGFSEVASSSVTKGESTQDTIRTISGYTDIIAMRHPIEGAPKAASFTSYVPVINAGDGSHLHPTQTLTDLLTIKALKGHISNFKIGLCGDLKFGRTVHSLVKALSLYENIQFVFISPTELQMPQYIKSHVKNKYCEVRNIEDCIEDLDILYMTRVQKERFCSEQEYLRLKDSYILDRYKLSKAKKDMLILHPLPRLNEINVDVDEDSRAVYFQQTKYGMYIRMALIMKLLGLSEKSLNPIKIPEERIRLYDCKCGNSKCITNTENVEPLFYHIDKDTYGCLYCDNKVKGREIHHDIAN